MHLIKPKRGFASVHKKRINSITMLQKHEVDGMSTKKMQKKKRRGKETRTNDNQFQFCHAIFQCSSFITETIQSWTRKKPRPNKNTWHNHIWDFFWRFYMRWCHKLSIAQSFCIIFFNLKIARNVTNKKKRPSPSLDDILNCLQTFFRMNFTL